MDKIRQIARKELRHILRDPRSLAIIILMPILMTATVTGLGLLPLALGSGEAGREIEGPMAIVILGGLITSTALNLLVLPTLALRYGKFVHED